MRHFKILIVCCLVSGALALAVRAAVRPEPRELTLIARGMAFYLSGDPTPNPRLIAGRGETLRITLRNEDRGMAHDLAIPSRAGGRKSTPVLRDAGESADLNLRAPEEAGEYVYLCSLHSGMMRGVLEVR
jgi:hypothetical protein